MGREVLEGLLVLLSNLGFRCECDLGGSRRGMKGLRCFGKRRVGFGGRGLTECFLCC